MQLGAFSLSLAVSDLAASTAFYGHLGFEVTGGDGETWSILVNGDTVLGLFAGMFSKNMLTFNPGWDGPGRESEHFTDVRELKAALEEAGIAIVDDGTGDTDSGPGHVTIVDPDGNPILIDQHR